MPKRLLALAVILILGVAGFATADPGPNGSNNHGLCTALFNGSENGQSHKRNAGPFATLIANSPDGPSDSDDEGGSLSDAWDWCSDPANNPKGIGGNPDDPNQEGDTSGRSKPPKN
jgi:hypothetical protein